MQRKSESSVKSEKSGHAFSSKEFGTFSVLSRPTPRPDEGLFMHSDVELPDLPLPASPQYRLPLTPPTPAPADEFVLVDADSYPSPEELAAITKDYTRDPSFTARQRADAQRYAFCLIDAIFWQNYIDGIGALGHLAIIAARQCGIDPPGVMHQMVTYAVYAYRQKVICSKFVEDIGSGHYGSAAMRSMNFARSLNIMSEFASGPAWPPRFQTLYTGAQYAYMAYRGFTLLTNPRRLFLWFLSALRTELIRLQIYPTV